MPIDQLKSIFAEPRVSEEQARKTINSMDHFELARLGGRAYGYLSTEHRFLKAIFTELAQKFAQFVEVLSEVSERCALTDATNLLRLYERWLATGSERSADLLRQQGILVVPSAPDTVH